MITHQPFKPGSPNLDHMCKAPWLRSLLFWEAIDLDLQGQTLLVCTITHLLKLESTNLKQRCKTAWLRFLLFWGWIDVDLHVNFETDFSTKLICAVLIIFSETALVNISETIAGD